MTHTHGWSLELHSESSVPMVANPRYSCRSTPKQVCWWHHQIGHLPCCPCSLSGWQLAEWGQPVALLSGCVRYSRLPTGMLTLLPYCRGAPGHSPLPKSFDFYPLAVAKAELHSRFNPKAFWAATVFCFLKFCLHRTMEPQTWHRDGWEFFVASI